MRPTCHRNQRVVHSPIAQPYPEDHGSPRVASPRQPAIRSAQQLPTAVDRGDQPRCPTSVRKARSRYATAKLQKTRGAEAFPGRRKDSSRRSFAGQHTVLQMRPLSCYQAVWPEARRLHGHTRYCGFAFRFGNVEAATDGSRRRGRMRAGRRPNDTSTNRRAAPTLQNEPRAGPSG